MKRSPLKRRTPLKPGKRVYVRGGKTLVCAADGCDNTFYVTSSDIRRGRKYCSKTCSNAGRRVARTCVVCGEEFFARRSGLGRVKTCPKPSCRSEIRRRSKLGARNPQYRRGDRTGRRMSCWYAAREKTCRLCPRRSNLKLHHVVYEQHVRRRHGDPWDPDNSFTLCVTCHNHHHHDPDGRLNVSQLRPENIEFAFALLGPYAADYFVRYYNDDSGGQLMERAQAMQAAA